MINQNILDHLELMDPKLDKEIYIYKMGVHESAFVSQSHAGHLAVFVQQLFFFFLAHKVYRSSLHRGHGNRFSCIVGGDIHEAHPVSLYHCVCAVEVRPYVFSFHSSFFEQLCRVFSGRQEELQHDILNEEGFSGEMVG